MTLEHAQKTLDSRRNAIDRRYKPGYHLSVPAGWHNDPNGFGYYQGRAHLFYQFHPYDSVWGPMHWGHWVSDDLVHWQDLPVAMAPDKPFDGHGCFSGTALEEDGKLFLMYTGVSPDGSGRDFQQQCLAVSADGVHFEKSANNPVIGVGKLPEGASPYDFRDPKLEKLADGYRVITASQGEKGGQLLAFRSPDLMNWRFAGVYLDGLGHMAECPDVFMLDGKTAVIACVMGESIERFGTPNPVLCWCGHEEKDRLVVSASPKQVDHGLDFYAPQTMLTPDGRRVLIGWALSWSHVMPTHTLGHGWAGMMTLPRECTLDESGALCQKPIRELETLRRDETAAENIVINGESAFPQFSGAQREMEWVIDMKDASSLTINLMQTGEERFTLTYDAQTATLKADRSRCGWPMTPDLQPEQKPWCKAYVPLRGGKLHLRVFVDVSIIEVYADDGRTVMSSLAFPKGAEYGVSVCADGKAVVETAHAWVMGE